MADISDIYHDLELDLDNLEAFFNQGLHKIAITRALIDPAIPQHVKEIIVQTDSVEMIEGGK